MKGELASHKEPPQLGTYLAFFSTFHAYTVKRIIKGGAVVVAIDRSSFLFNILAADFHTPSVGDLPESIAEVDNHLPVWSLHHLPLVVAVGRTLRVRENVLGESKV